MSTCATGGGGVCCSARVGGFHYNTVAYNTSPQGPVGAWFWGIADLVGNILVAPDGTGSALRWMTPRGHDFDTDFNLLHGAEALVWEGDNTEWEASPAPTGQV